MDITSKAMDMADGSCVVGRVSASEERSICASGDDENVDSLAVIIPTMNRPEFLARTIRWYSKMHVHCYIGDSSPEPLDLYVRARECTRYTHYFHRPGLNEIQASYEVAQHSEERYLAWAGDDDFLTLVGLLRGQLVLDAEPDITSVAGYATIFATRHNEVWKPIESVVGAYPDHFFRVFRREMILAGWEKCKDLPFPEPETTKEQHVDGAWIRSKVLLAYLSRYDKRRTIDSLSLLRQVHPWRVTEDPAKREPWRARLGHRFPRLQYAHQWLRSWNQPLSLPAMRRAMSPYHDAFAQVEHFLAR